MHLMVIREAENYVARIAAKAPAGTLPAILQLSHIRTRFRLLPPVPAGRNHLRPAMRTVWLRCMLSSMSTVREKSPSSEATVFAR